MLDEALLSNTEHRLRRRLLLSSLPAIKAFIVLIELIHHLAISLTFVFGTEPNTENGLSTIVTATQTIIVQ